MDFLLLLLILLFSLGVVCALYAFVHAKDVAVDDMARSSRQEDTYAPIEEADMALQELTSMTKTIFSEMDGKYKELLFLYQMIDQKQQELDRMGGAVAMPTHNNDRAESAKPQFDITVDDTTTFKPPTFSHPRLKEILAAQTNGLSVAEIAKHLHMGQGEVQMILDLYRVSQIGRAN